jgi:hypothetical protein
MFLTCFSYFSCYFLILVFLHNHYLLILSRPFLAIRESNFLSRFSYLWHCEVVRRTCAPKFYAQHAGFLIVRRFLPFAEGFWCKRPLGKRESYLSYSQNPWTDTFLRDISPAKLRSTARDGIPKGFLTRKLG